MIEAVSRTIVGDYHLVGDSVDDSSQELARSCVDQVCKVSEGSRFAENRKYKYRG